jgi:hypothetical protein
MAYAASALSFMLENLGKPVVFTGSQARNSALQNLKKPWPLSLDISFLKMLESL